MLPGALLRRCSALCLSWPRVGCRADGIRDGDSVELQGYTRNALRAAGLNGLTYRGGLLCRTRAWCSSPGVARTW